MMFLLRKIKEYCYSFVVTNKSLCHPEFSSGSQDYEMLKQVQHDNKLYLTFRKAFAFTLAETLIVMGIIGVVAALTIPNLSSSTADKEKVAKVKKIYSNINDAMGRAEAVYGPVEEWFQNDTTETAQSTRFGERVSEFMKVSKTCGTSSKGCFTSGAVKNGISGTADSMEAGSSFYKIITADGTAISFRYANVNSNEKRLVIHVDIDGAQKGSYTLGKDVFEFKRYLGSERSYIEPEGESWDSNFSACISQKNSACTHWIIANDNMDYLKADASGKCPNGRTILNGTTNTSCK